MEFQNDLRICVMCETYINTAYTECPFCSYSVTGCVNCKPVKTAEPDMPIMTNKPNKIKLDPNIKIKCICHNCNSDRIEKINILIKLSYRCLDCQEIIGTTYCAE